MDLKDMIRFFNPDISDDQAAQATRKLVEVNDRLVELVRGLNESPLARNLVALKQAVEEAAMRLPALPEFAGLKDIDPERMKQFVEAAEHPRVAYLPALYNRLAEPEPEVEAIPAPPPAKVIRGFRKDE